MTQLDNDCSLRSRNELERHLECPTACWQIGPFQLCGQNWLRGWSQHADEKFHRVGFCESSPKLQIELRKLSDQAYDERMIDVQSLSIVKLHNHYAIEIADTLHASLSLDSNLLQVDLLAHANHPTLTFQNAIRGAVSIVLPRQHSGLMFHASSGILDNHGVFFPGISTAGKTTLALGFEKVTYLSDDITLTRNLEKSPTLTASPFFGIAGRKGANEDAPLAAVGILVSKNPENTLIARLSTKDALRELMRHAICWSQDAELHEAIFAHVNSLVQQVPVFAVERYIGDSSDTVMERVLEAAAKCR